MSFLADTWWFGLTARYSRERFTGLAELRQRQGFTAVQLVCGIPPEVGPQHPSAASEAGPAWELEGAVNPAYLELARERIEVLIEHRLLPIVYGAWGHQIDWLGPSRMIRWWSEVARALGDLDVVWCLTGEAGHWLRDPDRLGLRGSTDDRADSGVSPRSRGLGVRIKDRLESSYLARRRRRRWTTVLRALRAQSPRPILVHPTPGILGTKCVDAPELLHAETVQTGHERSSEARLWQGPLAESRRHPGRGFINLEPWYEGLREDFRGPDQTRAFWLSMLAGATGHAYGAQGIWNGGDGRFLAHWGTQSFEEARALETPAALGRAWALWRETGAAEGEAYAEVRAGRLLRLGRRGPKSTLELCSRGVPGPSKRGSLRGFDPHQVIPISSSEGLDREVLWLSS